MQIADLYHKIYDTEETKESRKFVEVYEQHRELVESQHLNGDEELYFQVSRLRSDYATCLTRLEQWTKALPEINTALELFERNPKYKGSNLYDIEFYTHLKFDRVVCNYSLKNFQSALTDLNELHRRFPDNDKYKNWIKGAELYKLQQIERILTYLIAAAIFANIFFDGLTTIGGTIATAVLGLSLIGVVIIEVVKWLTKRRKYPPNIR